MQKQIQTQLFYRNMIALGASLMLFGMFVTLGPELQFTITAPLLSFQQAADRFVWSSE